MRSRHRGGDGSRTTGAFFVLLADRQANESKANRVQLIEDGVTVFLTDPSWQKMREAMASGSCLLLPSGQKGEPRITFEWIRTPYTSPVTGEKVVTHGFEAYHPATPAVRNPDQAIRDAKIVLLTSDEDLKARTTVDDLASYIKAMDQVVQEFFAPPDRRISRDLTLEMELTAGGHRVQFAAKPELSAEAEKECLKRLNDAAAPKVTGPVKLDYTLKLWTAVPVP